MRTDKRPRSPDVEYLFRDYAKGFFDGGSDYWKRQEAMGRTCGPQRKQKFQGYLDNHLIPIFGNDHLRDLNRKRINEGIMSAINQRSGEPLAWDTRNQLLLLMRAILDDAEDATVVPVNWARTAKSYRGERNKRSIFTLEELAKFFPADHDRALWIWGNQEWLTCFRILAATGRRPSEIGALWWENWYRGRKALVVSHALEVRTRKRKGTKTGQIMAAPLDDACQQELLLWETASQKSGPHDYVFPCAFVPESILKHLRWSAKRAGVDIGDRTTYSFRHTFDTHLLPTLTVSTLQKLMGHTTPLHTLRTYNKPTPEMAIDAVEEARDAVTSWTESWTRSDELRSQSGT